MQTSMLMNVAAGFACGRMLHRSRCTLGATSSCRSACQVSNGGSKTHSQDRRSSTPVPSHRHFSADSHEYVGGVLVGVDEAGRGCLAGPVVAAAVAATQEIENEVLSACIVRDSKKMSPRQREVAYKKLMSVVGLRFGVGLVEPGRIDEINILQATFEAMAAAVDEAVTSEKDVNELSAARIARSPVRVLVDGNLVPPQLQGQSMLQCTAVTHGDDVEFSIAAASIIAKVQRDEIMRKLALEHPLYGFERHKGYGTKVHMDAIRSHGLTVVHRRSFRSPATPGYDD